MKPLSLSQLDDKLLIEQEVVVRGFLYPTAENGYYLAEEPNLRHCCVGNVTKRAKQLYIAGPLPRERYSNELITLRGKLNREYLEDASVRYVLEDASLEPYDYRPYPYITITIAAILIAICIAIVRCWRKSDNSIPKAIKSLDFWL